MRSQTADFVTPGLAGANQRWIRRVAGIPNSELQLVAPGTALQFDAPIGAAMVGVTDHIGQSLIDGQHQVSGFRLIPAHHRGQFSDSGAHDGETARVARHQEGDAHRKVGGFGHVGF